MKRIPANAVLRSSSPLLVLSYYHFYQVQAFLTLTCLQLPRCNHFARGDSEWIIRYECGSARLTFLASPVGHGGSFFGIFLVPFILDLPQGPFPQKVMPEIRIRISLLLGTNSLSVLSQIKSKLRENQFRYFRNQPRF